jgi:hypothetical protein
VILMKKILIIVCLLSSGVVHAVPVIYEVNGVFGGTYEFATGSEADLYDLAGASFTVRVHTDTNNWDGAGPNEVFITDRPNSQADVSTTLEQGLLISPVAPAGNVSTPYAMSIGQRAAVNGLNGLYWYGLASEYSVQNGTDIGITESPVMTSVDRFDDVVTGAFYFCNGTTNCANLGEGPIAGEVNFTLTSFSISVVPIPAAVWLFGSGLGLLGWFRRRQTA